MRGCWGLQVNLSAAYTRKRQSQFQRKATIPRAWEADGQDEDQLWQMGICWSVGSNGDAYHIDKEHSANLILMWCTLIIPIHIYMFSLSLHLSFIFIFLLLHTIFIFTSSFFPVLSQHICPLPLSLSLSLWLKLSLPDQKVSTLPKTEMRSIKSFCGMPPGAKWMKMIKSWCSGLQWISISSPGQSTLFTIRQNLSEVFCFLCALPEGEESQKTLWVWVSNMKLKHSTVLPLPNFLPNNLGAPNNLFSLSQHLFFIPSPGPSWAEGDSVVWSLAPGW